MWTHGQHNGSNNLGLDGRTGGRGGKLQTMGGRRGAPRPRLRSGLGLPPRHRQPRLQSFSPNYGLFPVVTPVVPPVPPIDEPWNGLMQLTGAERARLQEGGIANSAIDRVEHLLLAMDDHAAADAGPEVRWALCRLLQRAEEAINSIDCLMEILLRRLRPRGVWPIIRVPRTELEQWRRFNWIRQYTGVFTSTLERHLSTPLQPQERLESPPRPAPPITASELPTPPSSSSGPTPRQEADTGVTTVPNTGDGGGDIAVASPSSSSSQ